MDNNQQNTSGSLFAYPSSFDFSAMSQANQHINSPAMSQAHMQPSSRANRQAMSQANNSAMVQTNHHGFYPTNLGPMSQGLSPAFYQANNMSMSQDTQQAEIPAYNQAISEAIQQATNEAYDSVEPETNQPANKAAYKPCGCSGPGGAGICGYVYTSPQDAEAHYKAAHMPFLEPSGIKNKVSCPWPNCPHASTKGQMFRHWVKHGYPKAHPCDLCSKVFGTADQMKTHRRTHTGEKPYVCEACKEAFVAKHAFSTKHGLKEHIEVMHNGETHFCKGCNKDIAGRTNYNHHWASFHEHGVVCPGCAVKNRCNDKMWDHFVCQDIAHVAAGNSAHSHICGGHFLDDRESFNNWWQKQNDRLCQTPAYAAWVAVQEGRSRAKAVKNKERVAEKKRKASAEEGEEIDDGVASPSKRSRSSSGDPESAATKARKRNEARKAVKDAGPKCATKRIRQTIPPVQPPAQEDGEEEYGM
ncbi:hypothetical protein MBLNU457_5582t1 [Dothideomycetes sp. NU457]